MPFPANFHNLQIKTNGAGLYVRVGGHGPAVVPDLRGMGLLAHPDAGYTKKTQTLDIVGVMNALKVQEAALATHDIGNMVGYALAAQLSDPKIWHFNFHGPDEGRLVANASTSTASGMSFRPPLRASMKQCGSTTQLFMPCRCSRWVEKNLTGSAWQRNWNLSQRM